MRLQSKFFPPLGLEVNLQFVNKPRDIVVKLLKLLNWHVKSKILNNIWEQAGLEIEGS